MRAILSGEKITDQEFTYNMKELFINFQRKLLSLLGKFITRIQKIVFDYVYGEPVGHFWN